MNIYEAVLQPIAAFVYTVIASQQPVIAGRQKSEISARRGACATNSVHGRGFAKIIL